MKSGGWKGNWYFFFGVIFLCLLVYVLLALNMVRWSSQPDYGWRAMYDSGPHVVAEIFQRGRSNGLEVGDIVAAINGKPYSTFGELFFEVRLDGIGEINRYSLLRDGDPVQVSIRNEKTGFTEVLKRSGPAYLIGLIYVFIGVIVFLMKPGAVESWVFLGMMATLGTQISLASPSDLMRPYWMYDIRLFLEVLIPAPIIHLSLLFPKKRAFFIDRKLSWLTPYFIAAIIFVLYKSVSSQYWNNPMWLNLVNDVYLLIAILSFVVLVVWNILFDKSVTVRLQSQVIAIGLMVGFLIPMADLILRKVAGVFIFPDPATGLTLSVSAFPLSVAYSLVKHDLFAIDVFVRRTYGYILSTSAIIALYGSVVSLLNFVFQGINISRTPAFSLGFALLVVFTFRPLHERIQGFVDRVFYRQKYDYRKTIKDVSEALVRILDPEKINRTLIGSVTREMYLENGLVMLSEPSGHFFTVRYAAGDLGKRTEVIRISEEDEICRVLHGDDALFRHEIDLNPAFENSRDDLIATFQELDSELILPLKYEDEIRGIVSFGRKKSGKMFTLEDVDLLKTIVNQGAIAIENARLAEKMKQEESVRTNLARYLSPQVVEQVLHEDMEVNLGGARKTVTVLFSDIRKFTSITETRPPDELITILNEYFTEMARIIFEQQGSLDKYIGDAIVAVFGSLVEVENPAEHAVNAAIQMMELMPQLNKRWSERFDGFSMDIGIGINTGEVFLGNIGSPERMEFTVIGDTVNVASRFSDLAGPGEILITREVSRSLGGKIPLEEMSPSEVKGKSGELDVYRVIT